MKIIRIISVFALLLFASALCYGSVVTRFVSREDAKALGVILSTNIVATNQVEVLFQYAPKGMLQTVDSVTLDISTGDCPVVSASLSPSKQTPDLVVYRFTVSTAYLSSSSLMVCCGGKSTGFPANGKSYCHFALSDFIGHD